MVLRVYSTLSRSKEVFEPIHGNRVNMFVCGPTPYDQSHLGHARTYVAYDIIARYLRYKGYSLFYLMNITDVDDRLIERARETGQDSIELARKYEEYFRRDMEALGVSSINLYARATEHIPEIIAQIETLLEKGVAYATESGVYFDVARFPGYGRLSHQRPDELTVHRIEPEPTKRNPGDFALWKREKPGEPSWASPWGRGRPGWHIEDTAIATTYLGPSYDIHGGAVELIFPHHEAEIAQAESATGVKPFVKYWVHTGILNVEGQKMSKSLGNFVAIDDAVKRFDAEALRFFFASTHYRSPIDYAEKSLAQASEALETLYNSLENLRSLAAKASIERDEEALDKIVGEARQRFREAMDDDFNTAVALAALFDLAKEVNRFASSHSTIDPSLRERIVETFRELGGILGILQREVAVSPRTVGRTLKLLYSVSGEMREALVEDVIKDLVDLILSLRERFREKKDWQTADAIRSRLAELGVVVEDTAEGARWRFAHRPHGSSKG